MYYILSLFFINDLDEFQFRYSTSTTDVKDEDDKYRYIEYSIVNNIGYIFFHIHWITLRISINRYGEIKFSAKYGNSGWIS